MMDSKPGSWHVQVHGSNARKVTFRQQAAWQRHFLAAPCAHWQGLQSSPCPGDLLKVTVRGLPVTKQHPSSPLEVASSSAELNAGAAASTSNSPTPSVSPVGTLYAAFLSGVPTPMADVEALITMGPSPDSPKGTPLVNRSQRPTLANPSNKLNPQVTLCSKCCALAKHCIAYLRICFVRVPVHFPPSECPLAPPLSPFSPFSQCYCSHGAITQHAKW